MTLDTLRRLRRLGLLLAPMAACAGTDGVNATLGSAGLNDTGDASSGGTTGAPEGTSGGAETSVLDDTGDSGPLGCAEGLMQACYDGAPSTQDVGECRTGMQTCSAGEWGPCEGAVLPAEDLCNGLDDDCDGAVDEDCECVPEETMECYGGPIGTTGVGECSKGVHLCIDGVFGEVCEGAVYPTPELCNGLDDDCDAYIDEGNPGSGAACATGMPGLCAQGTEACVAGGIVCEPDTPPSAEICFNGLDENCNGMVDENCFVCPYVFGFDGQRWAYETSVGGAGVVGRRRHLQPGHGKKVELRPLWARLDRTRVLADGSARVELVAAEDEIVYVDHAALTVVQHPEGHEVVSSSSVQWNTLRRRDPRRFWAFRSAAMRTPEAASWLGREDQRERLSVANEVPATYDRTIENFYELDFGAVHDSRRAWLVIDGWKLKERRRVPKPLRGRRPRLEVQQADGSWAEVMALATPRGDRKTVAFELGAIAWPTGRYAMRLCTGTHEGGRAMWYLDRVRLTEEAPAPTHVLQRPADEATLAFRGVPTRVDPSADDRPRESLNDGRGPLPAAHRTFGRFTRYGDVRPLLARADDRLVVMRRGDAIALRFDHVPPAPRGWTQTLFLRTTLLYKPRVVAGATEPCALTEEVGPLPYRGMGRYHGGSPQRDDPAYRRYLDEWNTREYHRDDPAWGPPTPRPRARTRSDDGARVLALAPFARHARTRQVSRLACLPRSA